MDTAHTEDFLDTNTNLPAQPDYLQLANIIVRWQDKVLLIHRKTDPMKGYWSIPGGGVEPGESYEAAAKRELIEEVGIEATDLKPMYVYITHKHKMESHLFMTESPDGKHSNPEPDEQDSASWLTVQEALKLQLTPGVEQALKSLR